MIIEARDDRVTLSGSLQKNLWPSIQAVAHLLLRQHPDGILIDASQISDCTVAGAKTFLDAIEYIDRYRARIVLCAVPDDVMTVLMSVPGVRSQVPIAETCEAARASLEMASRLRSRVSRLRNEDTTTKPNTILVPIIPGIESVREAIGLADALGRPQGTPIRGAKSENALIHIVYIIVVPRTLPINAPMHDEEDEARVLIAETESIAKGTSLQIKAEMARTRDASDEIAALAKRLEAVKIVLVLPKEALAVGSSDLIRTVLQKAPCEVILRR